MSGVYIARNACKFSPDEFSDHTDDSDFTYIPDNDTVLHTIGTTADLAAMGTRSKSYDPLGEPLNRTPLASHHLPEPNFQGNTQVKFTTH